MKITGRQLKQLIKEEVQKVLKEEMSCPKGQFYEPSQKKCMPLAKSDAKTSLSATGKSRRAMQRPAGVPRKIIMADVAGVEDPKGGLVFSFRDTVPIRGHWTDVEGKGASGHYYVYANGRGHSRRGEGAWMFAIDAKTGVVKFQEELASWTASNPTPWWEDHLGLPNSWYRADPTRFSAASRFTAAYRKTLRRIKYGPQKKR